MRRTFALVYGFLAYALFLGVFLYAIGFLANFLVPKSIDSGSTGVLWQAVAIDLALLGLFAVQHSGMARPGFKRWWTRVVPRPIERSTYVLLSSLVLALLFWQWRPIPGEIWSVEAAWGRIALWGLFALGWAILLVATFLISHAHLFGLRQVVDHHQGRTPAKIEFQTPGLYKIVRHPIMLGFLIAFWATPRMSAGHLLFAAASTGYIVIGVALEERDLVRAFGDRYRAYRARVPGLVPLPTARAGRPAAAVSAEGAEGE